MEEVRLRALNNLQFKLEQGFLDVEEVGRDERFLADLLCWLTGTDSDQHVKDILCLLGRISQEVRLAGFLSLVTTNTFQSKLW